MILWVGAPHGKSKFGDHRHCGSGDIMLLVTEEESSRCSFFNVPLLFTSKGHGLKAHNISLRWCLFEKKTSWLQPNQPSASVNWDNFNFRLHEKFHPGLQR